MFNRLTVLTFNYKRIIIDEVEITTLEKDSVPHSTMCGYTGTSSKLTVTSYKYDIPQ